MSQNNKSESKKTRAPYLSLVTQIIGVKYCSKNVQAYFSLNLTLFGNHLLSFEIDITNTSQQWDVLEQKTSNTKINKS